jgi:hypothetical protein
MKTDVSEEHICIFRVDDSAKQETRALLAACLALLSSLAYSYEVNILRGNSIKSENNCNSISYLSITELQYCI